MPRLRCWQISIADTTASAYGHHLLAAEFWLAYSIADSTASVGNHLLAAELLVGKFLLLIPLHQTLAIIYWLQNFVGKIFILLIPLHQFYVGNHRLAAEVGWTVLFIFWGPV